MASMTPTAVAPVAESPLRQTGATGANAPKVPQCHSPRFIGDVALTGATAAA
jgi:hypothetical protein